MTHGDKAKAKAAKSSKASVKEAGAKSDENGKGKAVVQTGKSAGKGNGAEGKTGSQKVGAEKAAAGSKKGSSAKESSRGADSKAKASAPAEVAGGFNNPVISAAFREALKKYPNAFRKLTD